MKRILTFCVVLGFVFSGVRAQDDLQQDLFSNYGGWVNLTAGYTNDTIYGDPMKAEIAVSGDTVHTVWAEMRSAWHAKPAGYGVWYRRSTDGGTTWENARALYLRRAEGWNGYSNMMAVEGNDVHIIVPDNPSSENPGTSNAMLTYLHSTDGGATFQTAYLDTVSVSYHSVDAAIIRVEGNHVAVAVKEYRNNNDVLKIYRSTDNGASFSKMVLDLPRYVNKLGDFHIKGDRWAALWSYTGINDQSVFVTTGTFSGDLIASSELSPEMNNRHYGELDKLYGANGDEYNFHPMMALTGSSTIHVLFHGVRQVGEEEGDPYRALYVRSDDFGETWGDIRKFDDTRNQHGTLVAKGNNVYIIVGSNYNRWIAYSNDNGDTWKTNKTMCYGSQYGDNYDSPRAYSLVIDPNDPTGSTAWYIGAKWLALQTKDGFNTLSYATRLDSYVRSKISGNRGSQMAPLLAIDASGTNHWLMREFAGDADVTGERLLNQLYYRHETAEPAPSGTNMAYDVVELKGTEIKNRIVIPQRGSLVLDSALTVGFWLRVDSMQANYPLISVRPNTPQTSIDHQAGGPTNWYEPGWGIGMEYRDVYNPETGKWDLYYPNITGYVSTDQAPDGKGVRLGKWVYNENEGYMIRKPGLWHYVAMTWDGRVSQNNARLFLDGMLISTGNIVGRLETGTNPIVIGNVSGSSSLYESQGWAMDELQIWNRALTDEEVFLLSSNLPVSDEGCLVHYGFDGTLKDLSGHGNDALAQLNCNLVPYEGLLLPKPEMQVVKQWQSKRVHFTDLTEGGEAIYWFFDDPRLSMGSGNCGSAARHAQHEYSESGLCHPIMVARGANACAPVMGEVLIGGLSKVEPAHAGQDNIVKLKIYGGYIWNENLNVRLHREGQEDIIGAWVKREGYNDNYATASEKLHYAAFNLAEAELGTWSMIVGNDTLPDCFTVEPYQAPDVWANIEGWSKMLVNKSKNFSIEYGNRGNVDAYNVPLFLFVSAHADVTLGFENPMYTPEMAEASPQVVQALIDSVGEYRIIDGGEYGLLKCYAFLIPRIPANSHKQQTVYVKALQDVDLFYLISDPWGPYIIGEDGKAIIVDDETAAGAPALRKMPKDEIDDIIDGGGGYGGWGSAGFGSGTADCMIGYLGWGVLDATMSAVPFLGCAWGIGKTAYQGFTDKPGDRWGNLFTNTLGTAFSCAMDFNPLGWGMRATTLASFAFNTAMNIRSVADCPSGDGGGKKVKAVGSYDPNEMIGPDGYGDNHYIKPAPEMSYTITYENKSTATAPAHEVFVYDTLSASMYDLASFSFTSFGWADTIIRVDGDNMKEFVQDIVLEEEQMVVRVSGEFDAETGIATWSFITLDMNLNPEEDPDKGYLIPNNADHAGEGFVSFAINHLSELGNGAQIANKATIIFDANAPIETNNYINTLDADLPQSQAISVSRDANNQLVIEWTALDATSGIGSVDLYVSKNDGEYELVEAFLSGDSYQMPYERDTVYCFATIARDNVGWTEFKENGMTCEATFTTQDIEKVSHDHAPAARKIIVNGKLYIILQDEKVINVLGQQVQ